MAAPTRRRRWRGSLLQASAAAAALLAIAVPRGPLLALFSAPPWVLPWLRPALSSGWPSHVAIWRQRTPATPRAAGGAGGEGVEEATAADVDAAVRAGGPVVLDVYAVWCGPCKLMEPVLDALSRELDRYADMCGGGAPRPRVLRMDSDVYERKASELHVEGLPTVIFFTGGAESGRLEGAVSLGELQDAAAAALRLDGFSGLAAADGVDSVEELELAVQMEDKLVVGVLADWRDDAPGLEASLRLLPGLLTSQPPPRTIVVNAGALPEAAELLHLADLPALVVFEHGEAVARWQGEEAEAAGQSPDQLASMVNAVFKPL
mmetsp:Transcript_41929/g.115628  ORF Transcript_41929/g.115628 Transcript_41929/m.115628 type:complete len:320 (-) Transcript_41929:34-993(-)